jgi:hypothetical protein
VVSRIGGSSHSISYIPDVIVADDLGYNLIYIDPVCMNSVVVAPSRKDWSKPVALMQEPPMIMKTNWSTYPSKG